MDNKKTDVLSIVLPSYNEEKNVPRTAKILAAILAEAAIPYELVFVNDGSRDGTWEAITQAAAQDACVVGVNFSRNFGKEAAIMAGLAQASGACCVVMDCDLQHPPETVVEMYRLWQEGYMVVEGVKRSRGKESRLHAFCARVFYGIMSSAVKIDMARASDFKLMDRKVVQALLSMPEHNAFFRALSSWVGFKSTSVEFDVQERVEGQSKWSTRSLVKYAVNNITSFSAAPLQLVTGCGVVMLLFSIILAIQTLVRYFRGNALEGFTTVILLQLLIGSILMISLGTVGYYLEKMFDELKARPRYLVADVIGGKNSDEEHA
jgi:dolichol-phosphate mannosyltransferase